MVNNLFSIFDPSTSIFSLSWMNFILVILLTSSKIWKSNNNFTKIKQNVLNTLKKEVNFSLMKTEKGTETIIMTIFVSIILMNFMALYPQIFSLTSHLSNNLPLSLTMWLSLTLFGWMKNTNHMLSHLLPQGTPIPLMFFMVMIELTSNIIRPITLCVRLTANLIAGHLLMSLMGNFLMNISFYTALSLTILPIMLSILESAVACIQAYVFMTLITLYTTEIK